MSDIGDPEQETEIVIVIEPADEPVPSVLPIEEPAPVETGSSGEK